MDLIPIEHLRARRARRRRWEPDRLANRSRPRAIRSSLGPASTGLLFPERLFIVRHLEKSPLGESPLERDE